MSVEERPNEPGHFVIVLGSIFLGKQYTSEEYNSLLDKFFKVCNAYLEDRKSVDPMFISNFNKEMFREYFYNNIDKVK
ncbi:MAG: hypothetical protein QW478_08530 [Candidatus Micrarchaeaceae archaeon]